MRKQLLWVLVLISTYVYAQKSKPVHPTEIKYPVGFAQTGNLRDKPVVTDFRLDSSEFYFNKHEDRKINPHIHPPADFNAIYQGQKSSIKAVAPGVAPDLGVNFAGQESGSYPPDANGSVNENYYFQVVNSTYTIYDKAGNVLAGPSDLNSIFDSNLPGTNCNDGDPIVLWDEQANKWFYSEFSICGNNDYMLIAVSQTDDPTGNWWSWSFDVDDTPDYMKFGIWQDGYYMATNTSNGNDVYVFERDKMITGDPNPAMIGFDNPNRPDTFDGFHCLLPMDNDGAWAPNGMPGQFITVADDDQNNPADELWIFELNADWSNPANSTFQRTQTLAVWPFTGNFNNSWENIPQPGTNQKLDAVSTVLMYRANYRNFGGDQRVVIVHTIAENNEEANLRWYELQNNGNGWAIRQQGNIDPDDTSRFNASIAINAHKEIAVGYSVSDANNVHPGIRFAGQSATENNAGNAVMDIDETVAWNGQNSQPSGGSYSKRWGDYSNMSVDPSDDRTFWYTNEYMGNNTHGTRIVSFSFPDDCVAPSNQASDFQANAQSETQIDLSWTRGDGDQVIVLAKQDNNVDADPQSGTSYNADSQFGSGDEIGTGNYVVYKGTGTSVSVTGLTASTTYYFAVYEFNNTDTCYLTPGATASATTHGLADVETLPMLQVNDFDAQGQGRVNAENGSPVTERGLCWGTSPNPTTSGAHASNGTGTGTYTVDLTNLNINTTYYVRAYAINSAGTAYGDNVSFSTGCVAVTDYPYFQDFNVWNESNPQNSCTADASVLFDKCWENLSGDDADWDIFSGATANAGTGPSDDVSGGGKYIYLEASGCNNKAASFLTPHFDFTDVVNPYMLFYAHMYGDDMGDLELYYTTDDGNNWNYVGKLTGNYGDRWIKVGIDYGALSGEADVQFKFTGLTGGGDKSDMAIDNFILKDYIPDNTDYCAASGNMDYDTAVTAVDFNTISNADGGKSSGYTDFTDVNTVIQRSQSYDLSVRVDTGGDYDVGVAVWIDWNRDKDFDDPGEEYDLGTATNVSDGATSDSPLTIVVPADAELGKTRMRVAVKYNDYPTACETDFDGEVEDYSLFVTTKCDDVAYWNGSVWYGKDYQLYNESDLNDKFLFIKEVFVTGGTSIDACGMQITESNKVTVNTGDYISLTHDLINDSKIYIENDASLVQTDNNAVIEGPNGIYKINRISQNMDEQYDYAFWSTPVQNFTLGGILTNAWGYYSYDPAIQHWHAENVNSVMQAGVGYAVSAPVNHTDGAIDVDFIHDNDPFYTGDVAVPLTVNGTGAQDDDDWNFVGNPYPSAIDFDALVNDNPNIQGGYYLWTNCAGLNANGQHQSSGYIVYTVGGGATAACNGNGPSNGQYISVAQGFAVEANASGNLVFKNSHRVNNNSPFVNRPADNSDRLWLDMTSNTGFSQTLVGFFDGATDQKDRLYDAHVMDASGFALYSLIGDEKFAVQGLSQWNDTQRTVPLGFVTDVSGTHQISLNRFEGVFDNGVNIYLKDLSDNSLHDLKTAPYVFSTLSGRFDNRFELVFTGTAAQVDENPQLEKINLLSNDGIFRVVSDRENLQKIEIYNLLGKKLLQYDARKPEKDILMNLRNVPHQLLLFKVTLTNGKNLTLKGVR